MKQTVKLKSTKTLLALIEPYIQTYQIEDQGSPADVISIADGFLRLYVEENQKPEISWVELEFFLTATRVSFESTSADYISQSADLIIACLSGKIELVCYYKGNRICRETYTLIHQNGKRQLISDCTFFHLFGKRSSETTIYQYYQALDEFRGHAPGINLINVIYHGDKARAEIYQEGNLYSFYCDIKTYVELADTFLWEQIYTSGFYDNENLATKEAKDHLQYIIHQ